SCPSCKYFGNNYAARRLLRAAASPTTKASLRLLARRLAAPAPAPTRFLRARASPTSRAALRLLARRLATASPGSVRTFFLGLMLFPQIYVYKTALPPGRLPRPWACPSPAPPR